MTSVVHPPFGRMDRVEPESELDPSVARADVIATVPTFEPSVRMSDSIFEPVEARG